MDTFYLLTTLSYTIFPIFSSRSTEEARGRLSWFIKQENRTPAYPLVSKNRWVAGR
jgi:hypothetical protein